MFFKNREDAAIKLAAKLTEYKNESDAIILGLPRGGVPIAAKIAEILSLPFDIIITKKLTDPLNPELAFGAVTQEGTPILDTKIIETYQISENYIQKEIEKVFKEIQRRLKEYRKNKPPLNLNNKTAIIVDDGIATGSTIKAAIESAKNQNAKKIIVAVPVAPPEIIDELKKNVDEIICLEAPKFFSAVGQFYESFPQLEDAQVIEILEKSPK